MGRVLIASIMEEYDKGAWEELIERCEETGVDAFEINFSCPHGMPERRMGMAMGQDCELLQASPSPEPHMFASSRPHSQSCVLSGAGMGQGFKLLQVCARAAARQGQSRGFIYK
jgi:hypothetical protein